MNARCPLCQKEFELDPSAAFRPFCSVRCKKIDLLNWLNGAYCLPRAIVPEDFEQLSPEEEERLFEALRSGEPADPKLVH